MAQEYTGEGGEAKPSSARFLAESTRRLALLDLINGEKGAETPATRHGRICLAPGHVREMMRQTALGVIYTEPGEAFSAVQILGLMRPGKLTAPVAHQVPDRAFWRACAGVRREGEYRPTWQSRLGVVFHYDTLVPDANTEVGRLVTAEEEAGLIINNNGIRAYRSFIMYVETAPVFAPETSTYKIAAHDIVDITDNMHGLMTPPREGFSTPPEWHGIDLSEFPLGFADTIEEGYDTRRKDRDY